MDFAPSYVDGRIGVVGLGLIGGSFAKAFAAENVEVYVYDTDPDVVALAQIETATGELNAQTIPSCELIILAAYPAACIAWLETHAHELSPDAIVIDTAGVKEEVCSACFAIADTHPFYFCGAHPMAGTQFSGFAHARATLFNTAPMVLCPPEQDSIERLRMLDRLTTLLAPCRFGRFSVTTPERHDELIAFTSQLAHVVSNAYVKSPTAQAHKGFSAGSYRDLTRVARLNAGMWTELFLDNAEALSFEIQTLITELERYKNAIDNHDAEELFRLLAEGDRLKREAESQ